MLLEPIDAWDTELTPAEVELLRRVAEGLPLVADISRADATLWVKQGKEAVVVAQAKPRSIASLYRQTWLGRRQSLEEPAADFPQLRAVLLEALERGRRAQAGDKLLEQGAAIVRQVFPILHQGRPIRAAMQLETSLIAWERQKRRSPSFQRAVTWLQEMAVRGDLRGTAGMPGLSEWDGILFVDDSYRIQYLSGIANNLYRRLGYLNELRGLHVGDLQTHDEVLVRQAFETLQCQVHQVDEGPLNWTRMALPIWSYRQPWWPLNGRDQERPVLRGALVLVHDNTEALRKAQEVRVLNAMVKDVHHRVKNNLQKVASLLRMQARRATNPETRRELEEAVNRILAVSTIHEFLTQSPDQLINIREISQRIVSKTQRSAIHPEAEVSFQVLGPAIYLPTRQATACALVIDELIINALKYAFPDQAAGRITIALEDLGDQVQIQVEDNGVGLPTGFDWQTTETLGLSIVRILVEDDLKGTFTMAPADPGTRAVVQFKKGSPTDD
ncbi:MAG: sensor histidine kinase [Caldilineales bacterium]|nr:sensor histidine kinase [Caldilineales bacterium]MDW8317264.1 histidine kinase N-terminal domain-containing protein [Anaerolineae bacterium]